MNNYLEDLERIEAKYCHEAELDLPGMTLDELEAELEREISDDYSEDELEDFTEDVTVSFDKKEEETILERLRNCITVMEKTRQEPIEMFPMDFLLFDEDEEHKTQSAQAKFCGSVQVTKLDDWYISITSQRSLIVNGKRIISYGDETKIESSIWHSTIVKERIDNNPRKLMTISGSVYQLENEINEKAMRENNFPTAVIDLFKYGFPRNWRVIIEKLLVSNETSHLPQDDLLSGKVERFSQDEKPSNTARKCNLAKRKMKDWVDLNDGNSMDGTSAPTKRCKIESEPKPDTIFSFPVDEVLIISHIIRSPSSSCSLKQEIKYTIKAEGKDDNSQSKCSSYGENKDWEDLQAGRSSTRKGRTMKVDKEALKVEQSPIRPNKSKHRRDRRGPDRKPDFASEAKMDCLQEWTTKFREDDLLPGSQIIFSKDRAKVKVEERKQVRDKSKSEDTHHLPNDPKEVDVTTCGMIPKWGPFVSLEPLKWTGIGWQVGEEDVKPSDMVRCIESGAYNQGRYRATRRLKPVSEKLSYQRDSAMKVSRFPDLVPGRRKKVRFATSPKVISPGKSFNRRLVADFCCGEEEESDYVEGPARPNFSSCDPTTASTGVNLNEREARVTEISSVADVHDQGITFPAFEAAATPYLDGESPFRSMSNSTELFLQQKRLTRGTGRHRRLSSHRIPSSGHQAEIVSQGRSAAVQKAVPASTASEGGERGDQVLRRRRRMQNNRPKADLKPDTALERIQQISREIHSSTDSLHHLDRTSERLYDTAGSATPFAGPLKHPQASFYRATESRHSRDAFVEAPKYPDSSFTRIVDSSHVTASANHHVDEMKDSRALQQMGSYAPLHSEVPTRHVSPYECRIKKRRRGHRTASPRDQAIARRKGFPSVYVSPREQLMQASDSRLVLEHPKGSSRSHLKSCFSLGSSANALRMSDSMWRSKGLKEGTSERRVIEEDWDPDEVESLKLALARFQPDRPYFWEKISDYVGTRAPAECQRKFELMRKHSEKAPAIAKKRTKKVDHLQVEPGANFRDVVTAARGTLRRKKQMRQFLEAQDRDYQDDIFESTPYRNRKKQIKLPLDPSKISAVFSSNVFCEDEEEDYLSSPSSPAYSSSESDVSLPATGSLVTAERDEADAYMMRYQKMRKKMPVNARLPGINDCKSGWGDQEEELVANVSQAFHTRNQFDTDSDSEEKDDYFQEESDIE